MPVNVPNLLTRARRMASPAELHDRPALESLVHNLEHGYTVVWYAESLPQAQQDELKRISELLREDDATAGKFIVSAWDSSRGELPEGKQVALSHWGKENGYRQLCGSVSGEAVKAFVAQYPVHRLPGAERRLTRTGHGRRSRARGQRARRAT
ncbi:MAG: DUF3105 domain-containing protein, partial [Gammaproteobacteria bacterium]|nr:DUF3105 domain-containing protein [Gammaproteobacteria bacterium]